MDKRLNWAELQELYPDQWVALINCEYEELEHNVIGGTVIDSARTASELSALVDKQSTNTEIIAIGNPAKANMTACPKCNSKLNEDATQPHPPQAAQK